MPDSKRIAVVDDDERSRLSLVSLLRSLGFEAHAYHSAGSYMADVADGWGCVISDIQMPEMDGFALLSAVARIPKAPPVILTTAFTIADVRDRASAAGAIWFFEKPADQDVLFSRLTAILAGDPQVTDA